MKNEHTKNVMLEIKSFVKSIRSKVDRLEKFLDQLLDPGNRDDLERFKQFEEIFAEEEEDDLPFEKIFPGTKSKVLKAPAYSFTNSEDLLQYKVEPMAEAEHTKPIPRKENIVPKKNQVCSLPTPVPDDSCCKFSPHVHNHLTPFPDREHLCEKHFSTCPKTGGLIIKSGIATQAKIDGCGFITSIDE